MLRGFDPHGKRDIVFVPVGINYDRTLEDRSLVRRLDPDAARRSRWFVLRTTFGFIAHNIRLMLSNRWQRFGYACVNFGTPISARDYCQQQQIDFSRLPAETRFAEIEKLGRHLMSKVERLVPVLPVALVAAALLEGPEGQNEFDIKARVYQNIERLQQRGAVVIMPSRTRAYSVDTALAMLVRRHLVVEANGQYAPEQKGKNVLSYYANSIGSWQE